MHWLSVSRLLIVTLQLSHAATSIFIDSGLFISKVTDSISLMNTRNFTSCLYVRCVIIDNPKIAL